VKWRRAALRCVFVALVAMAFAVPVGELALRIVPAKREGPLRVLVLGDAITYPLLVQPDESYPHVLQASWPTEPGTRPIEVLALGYPGTTSAQVRRDLPLMLAAMQPDVVTLMIGADDVWVEPVPRDDGTASRVDVWLKTHSRLYARLAALRKRDQPARLEVTEPVFGDRQGHGVVRYGDAVFELAWRATRLETVPGWDERLAGNLAAIVEEVRDARATPVLLTYPSFDGVRAAANATIRNVARTTETPLIDFQSLLRARCRTPKCPMLLFASGEPSPAAHLVVAQVLAERLRQLPH
jgi:lysophospholipase L1-like esterase